MPSSPLPDQAARDRLGGLPGDGRSGGAADLDTSFAVEAGAGSGKTTALVARVVALAEAGVDLRAVVAITFTRRAAAELRARSYEALADRAAALGDPSTGPGRLADAGDRRGHVRAALGALDAACFDTIHGFCGRLLRADALAAGLPPDFAVADEREGEEARVAHWRAHVRRQAGTPLSAALSDAGLRPADVEPLFETLVGHPDRLPEPTGADAPDLSDVAADTLRQVSEWQARRPDPPLGARDTLQSQLDTAERLATVRGLDRVADQAAFLEAVYDGCGKEKGRAPVTLNRWHGPGDADARASAKALRDEGAPELAHRLRGPLRRWEAYRYDAALAYARGAVAAFGESRRVSGQLTYDDLLHGAARLLRAVPAARARAAARYRHLLVDEFQDTDPAQAEVLFLLAAQGAGDRTAPTDWRACRPRPGSLVVVGDPKQSIYRFRRADIETYAEVVRLLEGAGGERLALTTCFRTRPALCRWANGALRPPFDDDCDAQGDRQRQAPYVDLVSGRGPSDAAPHVARLDTPKVDRNGAEAIAEAEARRLAAFVRAAVDGHADPALHDPDHGVSNEQGLRAVFGRAARYGDVMVLCRASTRFGHYARAFEAAGVPYTLGGDKKLGMSDEAGALLALLDAARDPLDGAALFVHRVGLLGGLSAPDLLVAHGHPSAPGDPDGAHGRAVADADAVVERARETLGRAPVGTALEEIAAGTGLLAHAAARPGGAERAGGLLRLLARARGYQAEGLHWTEAHDRLRDLVDGATSDGRITVDEGSADAVRILTVHQSKGLEAPVVVLSDPYSRGPGAPTLHTGRDADGTPFVTAPLVREHEYGSTVAAAPPEWYGRGSGPGDAEEAALYEDAEARRVAYVAATRARNLVVVSRYLPKPGEGPWGLFHAGLDDAPALEELAPGAPGAPATMGAQAAGGGEPPVATFAELARPSVARRSPSDHGAGPESPTYERASGVSYGSAYGSAVHGLFEWAVRNRDAEADAAADRARAEALWVEAGAAPDTLDEGLDALARLRGSDLWGRVAAAEAVLAEAPVSGPAQVGDGGGPGYLVGTVDLAYRDADGWHLVDYKTDGLTSLGHRGELADYYGPQLRTYADLWAAVTDAAPVTLALHYTDPTYGDTHPLT